MSNDKEKIDEALSTYYKLKNKYENEYYDKIGPIASSLATKKVKKRWFKELPKPKCMNCMRNVGMIFSIKTDAKNVSHLYNAQCGDIEDPCPLDIRIEMPNIERYSTILSSYNLNNLKKDIIKAKNDLLFGYIKQDDAFKIFDELTSKLKEETVTYDFFLDQYITLFDNIETKQSLQKKQVDLGLAIQEFKDMISESKKRNDTQIVNSAVEFYINTIIPLLNEIEHLKYPYNRVELTNGEYQLVQKKNTIEQTFIDYSEAKIIAFVIGTKSKQRKSNKSNKSKTVKVAKADTETETETENKKVKTVKTVKTVKNKTKKNKPILEVISENLGFGKPEQEEEEPEEEEQEPEPEEEEQEPKEEEEEEQEE